MASSILVNSLKRLYAAGRVTKEQLKERVAKEIISAEDYKEITGEEFDE